MPCMDGLQQHTRCRTRRHVLEVCSWKASGGYVWRRPVLQQQQQQQHWRTKPACRKRSQQSACPGYQKAFAVLKFSWCSNSACKADSNLQARRRPWTQTRATAVSDQAVGDTSSTGSDSHQPVAVKSTSTHARAQVEIFFFAHKLSVL